MFVCVFDCLQKCLFVWVCVHVVCNCVWLGGGACLCVYLTVCGCAFLCEFAVWVCMSVHVVCGWVEEPVCVHI